MSTGISISIGWPILLVGIAVAVLFYFRYRGMRGVSEPVCGKCGYCVRGLPTLTCPECGSDLREVGIVRPDVRRPMNPRLFVILLWTALLPIPVLTTYGLLHHLLTSTIVPRIHQRQLEQTVVGRTGDLAIIDMHITLEGSIRERGRSAKTIPAQTMTIRLQYPVRSELVIDLENGTLSYQAKDGHRVERAGPFDKQILAEWLTEAGVDTRGSLDSGRIDILVTSIRSATAEWQRTAGLANTGTLPFRTRSGSRGIQAALPRGSTEARFSVEVSTASDDISERSAWSWAVVGLSIVFFWIVIWWLGIWFGLRLFRPRDSGSPATPG